MNARDRYTLIIQDVMADPQVPSGTTLPVEFVRQREKGGRKRPRLITGRAAHAAGRGLRRETCVCKRFVGQYSGGRINSPEEWNTAPRPILSPVRMAKPPQYTSFYSSYYIFLQTTPLSSLRSYIYLSQTLHTYSRRRDRILTALILLLFSSAIPSFHYRT
ncbi:hypothetical protein EVAR_87917_1 [Eumeta japonica]|uniref:Uncharacterized protein n=1 Tax=Eumeta variegata TaxID=151549 RepID=A0A4C1WVB7_EUMVA|nr:hypothetical protein EVAR_87917_1 [Eumeta japonica]